VDTLKGEARSPFLLRRTMPSQLCRRAPSTACLSPRASSS
jgi:hypothetical protein